VQFADAERAVRIVLRGSLHLAVCDGPPPHDVPPPCLSPSAALTLEREWLAFEQARRLEWEEQTTEQLAYEELLRLLLPVEFEEVEAYVELCDDVLMAQDLPLDPTEA